MIAALLVVLLTASSPASAVQSSCLEFAGTKNQLPPPPEERTTIRLSEEGKRRLAGSPFALLQVERPAAPPADAVVTVRLLEGDPKQTRFTFARPGSYTLRLLQAQTYEWPNGTQTGQPVPGCGEQQVTIVAEMRPPFDGTRAHAWVTYRPIRRFEAAGSVYQGRLGIAGVFEFDPFSRDDDLNRWNVGADVRWRGARGYLGGGVRYFPDEEFNRYRVRPVVVAGEELPAFRGHPVWFLFDLRVDEKLPEDRWKLWKPLRFSFGVRLDLTGNVQ